jgi:high-affinity iron transporter
MILLAGFATPVTQAYAAEKTSYANWEEVATAIEQTLEESYDLLLQGELAAAREKADFGYFGIYDLALESLVASYISGDRKTQSEYLFTTIKKQIMANDIEGARASIDELVQIVHEDARLLDGDGGEEGGIGDNPTATFVASFVIIAREGVEAILIVGALIAYLKKSGNKSQTRNIYIGSVIAILASVVMALILNALAGAETGANQEVIEGVTMLIAVAVLFYVSVWMISKAESEAWSRFVEGKAQSSIKRGSAFALAFAAFLAVFREGAEIILFYGALNANVTSSGSDAGVGMIWLGLAVGIVFLVAVYLLIRLLGMKIPLKPFFTATSILMFIMSISFIGSGVKELQEGNVIDMTQIPGMFTVDILGIYPTLETLIPQIILLAAALSLFIYHVRKNKRLRATLSAGKATEEPS